MSGGLGLLDVLGMVAFVLGLGLAYGFVVTIKESIRTAINRPEQRQRETEAEALLSEVRSGNTTKVFWLYLRSFQSDNLSVDWDRAVTGFTRTPTFDAELTVDELLMRGLRERYGPALCVGRKGFLLGAARVESTDELWRSDVALLAKHASLIVLMPWDSDSVLEEFATIVSAPSLRRKAVFFMPPFSHGRRLDWKWETAKGRLKHLPVPFPDYTEEGRFFTWDGRSCTSFVLLDAHRVGEHLQDLLAGKEVQLRKQ